MTLAAPFTDDAGVGPNWDAVEESADKPFEVMQPHSGLYNLHIHSQPETITMTTVQGIAQSGVR